MMTTVFDTASSVPSYDAVDPGQFRRLAAARTPFAIRDFASTWPAVKRANKSDEELARYLAGQAVKRELPVIVAPAEAEGLFFYKSDLRGLNFNRQQVALPLFLEHLLHLRSSPKPPGLFIQSTPIDDTLSRFSDENPNPYTPLVGGRMWLGNRTRVATHFDVADNFAVVVAGKRRFLLFPPETVGSLYVGPLDFTLAGQPVSLVDPRNPDLLTFPKFSEAAKMAMVCELEPGDAIYIPSPWWHHVEALSGFNMLVNYWWRDYPEACGTPFHWLIHGLLSIRHLPEAERAAWRSMADHYIFEADGDPAAHLPPHARSVLGEMTPELANQLRKWIRDNAFN
jgi:hypothetical protein